MSGCNFTGALIIAILFLFPLSVKSQEKGSRGTIFIISDAQEPLPSERLLLGKYRNEEARDTLFGRISRSHPRQLFMLGDMVSRGSDKSSWEPLKRLLASAALKESRVFVTPGNHEYMFSELNGIRSFIRTFGTAPLTAYTVRIDSVAVIMINSCFGDMGKEMIAEELRWYSAEMKELDSDHSVRAVIVCTHYSPYTNSKVVSPSVEVQNYLVPDYEKSAKSILFISGHSHNLEYFCRPTGKHYLVAGGGGGLIQPLYEGKDLKYNDLLMQKLKPLYFYITVGICSDRILMKACGPGRDFVFTETTIGTIPYSSH
jgi:hypothetical protein